MDELEQARLRIYAIEDGAVRAQALAFALRAGLFERLEESPMTIDELGADLGLSMRILPALVALLTSEGLLKFEDGRFANSPSASAFLLRASPGYVGGRSLLFQGFYDAIRHLPESLATGMPWTAEGQHDMFAGFGPEEQQWFADGMFANAVHGARALLDAVDLAGSRRLLDVGGNAGGYALTLLAALPDLTATIVDLDPVRPLARQRIAAAGLELRASFVAASFFDDGLPRGHDTILLASVLHDWGDGDCEVILRNCYSALDPGGLVIVSEPMLREDATGPGHPAASGLTMALLGGENRTRARIQAFLVGAGFVDCWLSPVGEQTSTVTARKPA